MNIADRFEKLHNDVLDTLYDVTPPILWPPIWLLDILGAVFWLLILVPLSTPLFVSRARRRNRRVTK